jgi:hypothetical protein
MPMPTNLADMDHYQKTAWAIEVTPRSILRLFDALFVLYPGATITTPHSTVTMESCRATSAYYDEKGIK